MKWLVLSALFMSASSASADPLSKVQLLELLDKKVDPQLVLDLVKRDCVSFDVDAATVVELSQKVPTPILQAAMDCRGHKAVVDPATRAAAAAPAPESLPALTLPEIKKVAVAQVTLGGVRDIGITSYLIAQVRSRKPGWEVIEPTQLQLSLEASSGTNSAPLSTLLAAARRAGADAILLSDGSYYSVMGAPGVSLHVQLLEVNQGNVLWSADGASKGGGFSDQNAKHMAVRSAARKLPQ